MPVFYGPPFQPDLDDRAPFRPDVAAADHGTIFALLYGLGLRVGEVARLTIGDVDADRRLLVIRQTKFGKSRLVPFGPQSAAPSRPTWSCVARGRASWMLRHRCLLSLDAARSTQVRSVRPFTSSSRSRLGFER